MPNPKLFSRSSLKFFIHRSRLIRRESFATLAVCIRSCYSRGARGSINTKNLVDGVERFVRRPRETICMPEQRSVLNGCKPNESRLDGATRWANRLRDGGAKIKNESSELTREVLDRSEIRQKAFWLRYAECTGDKNHLILLYGRTNKTVRLAF